MSGNFIKLGIWNWNGWILKGKFVYILPIFILNYMENILKALNYLLEFYLFDLMNITEFVCLLWFWN